MKTIHIIIALFLFQFISAQEEMNLPKAISIGLENNYGIKINDRFILIAENNNNWARAGKLPTIDLSANFGNTITQDNNPASFLQGEFYNGGLSATLGAQWVVYAGGRVKIAKDQLSLAVDQQKLNKLADIHDLMRIIYQQYYDVLFQQERLIVLQSSLELSRSRMEYEETKRAFGTSSSFNILQFENAILSDSTNLINQQQGVEISKRNLYNTLNIIGFPNYSFSERLNTQAEDINVDRLEEALSEDNYTLKTLNVIASLNQLNTRLEQSSLLPTISVSGSVTGAENGFKFFADNPMTGEPFDFLLSNRLNGNVSASANWRIFDGGVRKTNIQNAKIQEDIDQLNILEAKAKLANQLRILADNYENQKVLLSLSDDQIELAERNLVITEERFKGGLISSIDFRNIQIQYLSAAFGKVNAIYSLILTKSEIDYLVGRYEESN